MILKKIWYNSVKLFIKITLQFYSKRIIVKGRKKVPRKGAVLFAINHPNALIDPLLVTSNNPRENHYLVRADVFKKPLIRKALASLNLMPIYRIRDGIKQLSNNEEIFEKCFEIFKKKQTLFIFPQGGHSRQRTIQPLSKGFTRIVFGALEKYPDLDISVVPVGVTYQNSATFPCKASIYYGDAINSREIFEKNPKAKSINILKNEVSEQLKKLTVHIPNDENYDTVLQKLNDANVNFTKVDKVNKMIASNTFPKPKKKTANYLIPIYYLIVINSIIPYLIWKKQAKKIDELEFVDTFRYGFNIIAFPLFYCIQSVFISYLFDGKAVLIYLMASVLLILFYAKFSPTNTEES